MTPLTEQLQADVEARISSRIPGVELLVCEQAGAGRLRLVIDHPDGVSLAMCERVARELGDLLHEQGLEVSSPGPQRPLVKPDHFRRFLGRRAQVRVREPRDGHRSFTGELVGASDAEVTVAADGGVVAIPYSEIARSHLVESGNEATGASKAAGKGGSES